MHGGEDGTEAADAAGGVEIEVLPDRQVWTLERWPVTQLAFETGAVRLAAWRMDGSVDVRIAGRLRLTSAAGDTRLDAADTSRLAPLLDLLDRPLRRIEVAADGALRLAVGGATIQVDPDPRFAAWDAHGAGAFDGMRYRCPPGGGAPW